MQTKSFINWVNLNLNERKIKLKDFEEFKNGLNVIYLMEVLSKKPITNFNKNPKMMIHCTNNLQLALERIKIEGIRLENIGATDIYNYNKKLILGLIWTLILHYQIAGLQVDEEKKEAQKSKKKKQKGGKALLLDWLKKQTAGYFDEGKKIDLTSSFSDGLILCAIVDSKDPNLINYKELNPKDAIPNTKLGMNILERKFGVPHILEPEDLCNEPDEKSVMTYVSLIISKIDPFQKEDKKEGVVGFLPGQEEEKKRLEEEERKRKEEEEKKRLEEEEERKRKEEEERIKR